MKATDSGRVRNVINRRRIREIVFFTVITGVPIIQFCLFYIGVNVNSLLLAFKTMMRLPTHTYSSGRITLCDFLRNGKQREYLTMLS